MLKEAITFMLGIMTANFGKCVFRFMAHGLLISWP